MNIKIYTDGACSGNPGAGGWGCILSTILPNGQPYEVKHSAGYRLTTNNRMELLAVIEAFMYLTNGGNDIEVISDSKYVTDAFNQHWIDGWRKRGWRKVNGPLPNRDMWQTLWNLVTMQRSVKWTWIKGHDTNPYNNECDRLAVCARQDTQNLLVDAGYESGKFN